MQEIVVTVIVTAWRLCGMTSFTTASVLYRNVGSRPDVHILVLCRLSRKPELCLWSPHLMICLTFN